MNLDARNRTAKIAILVAAVTAAAAACVTVVTAGPHTGPLSASAAAPTPNRAAIIIDGAHPGPVFQGVGAISSSGNSRLLIDYPARARAQILDYLFSPHFGASLQMLKLEIGGGGYSSDGSEPSVQGVQGRLDCAAGYEFWLARQALARNSAIKLYGLQWSAPSWVRDSHGALWTPADARYVVSWLRCAREIGLTISYIGGWNEHYDGAAVQRAWYVDLRKALDAAGFTSTRIVAADQSPQRRQRSGRPGYSPLITWRGVADDMAADPAFNRAVSVLGVHDTCGFPTTGYLRTYTLSLTASGVTISARINRGRVATVTNGAYREGPAGLGSLGYYPVRYASLTVR